MNKFNIDPISDKDIEQRFQVLYNESQTIDKALRTYYNELDHLDLSELWWEVFHFTQIWKDWNWLSNEDATYLTWIHFQGEPELVDRVKEILNIGEKEKTN